MTIFCRKLQNSLVRWPVSANLPTQKPTTQQFVVLSLTALLQHNELLCCEVTTQQFPHRTPQHNQLLCRGGSVWEYCCVVVFNSQHNNLLCCRWQLTTQQIVVSPEAETNSQRKLNWYCDMQKKHGNNVASTIASTSVANWLHFWRHNELLCCEFLCRKIGTYGPPYSRTEFAPLHVSVFM